MRPDAKDFKRVADSLVGIPYAKWGTDAQSGLSCVGLVGEFYKRLGVDLVTPISEEREDVLSHDWTKDFSQVDYPKDGDVVSFQPSQTNHEPGHLGVCVGRYILHSWIKSGVVMTRASTVIKGMTFYRYRGWDDE